VLKANRNVFFTHTHTQTSLRSLGLKSLKRVNSGAIVIVENKYLCFADDIDWNKIKKSKDHESVISPNRNTTDCRKCLINCVCQSFRNSLHCFTNAENDGEVCSEECSAAGCWGVGADECLECRNLIYKGTCLTNCQSLKK